MATPEEREAIRQASLRVHGYSPSGTMPPGDPELGPHRMPDDSHSDEAGGHSWLWRDNYDSEDTDDEG